MTMFAHLPSLQPCVCFADFTFVSTTVCSVQTGKQHQHAEERDEDRSYTCKEEAAQSLPAPRTGAEEEEGEAWTPAHHVIGTFPALMPPPPCFLSSRA